MTISLTPDVKAFQASSNAVADLINSLDKPAARRVLIDAAAAGLVNALRAHFRAKEAEPHSSASFPFFGRSFPKKYFWFGSRGTSVAEKIRIASTSVDGQTVFGKASIAIDSPPLKRQLIPHPPPITPKNGKKFLAIPASPQAAAFTGMPRDFPGGLRLAYSRLPDGHWLPSLVAASASKRSTQNAVAFYLVRKTNPKHSPNPLPSSLSLANSVKSVIALALRRIFP